MEYLKKTLCRLLSLLIKINKTSHSSSCIQVIALRRGNTSLEASSACSISVCIHWGAPGMSGLIASSLGSWNVSRQDAHSQNWCHPSFTFREVSLFNKPGVIQSGSRRRQLSHPFSGDLLTRSHVKCSSHLTSQGTQRWKLKNRASQGANGESRKLHLSSSWCSHFQPFPHFTAL